MIDRLQHGAFVPAVTLFFWILKIAATMVA